jgi:oxygen-independent coproporphyrinogen-3 oxidase
LPVSIEFSPDTTTPDRVAVLKERALDRASIGVQSFFEDEARAAGRPQKTATVHRALTLLREAGFPTLNIDLIYGLPGQTAETWRASLEQALRYRPEELFLYPLYVRPLTGLGRRELARADDLRPALYEHARELLLASGYTQVSMRLFRIASAPDTSGPAYCCQEDGMLGLGCGARSYTRSVHYASDYAVGAKGVKAILADWVGRTDAQLAAADLGFVLDGEDQRRRYAIQSLLWKSGLVLSDYRRRFGTDALDDLPQLAELEPLGLAACSEDDAAEDGEDTLRLTPEGLAMSDVLGPWLNSAKVAALMESYEAS